MNRRKWKWFTPEEIASWPVDHKRCRACDEVKHKSDFHNHRRGMFGVMNECKGCRELVSIEDEHQEDIDDAVTDVREEIRSML